MRRTVAHMHGELPYLVFYTERCAVPPNIKLNQSEAWERCPTLAPKRTPSQVENKPLGHRWLRHGNQHIGNDDVRVFCRKLDIMKRHEFVWEPYTKTVISLLPPICVLGSVAWYAVVPLICLQVIEWHQPDRVLRQFGMQPPIPEYPSQPLNINGITLKGKHDENWGQLFAPMIHQWNIELIPDKKAY
ncbi:Serine/threonine-protein phosphatase 7 long form [Glycine soja]